MDIPIEKELRDICKEINSKNINTVQWPEIESDDMFQSGKYIGGFDADETEFYFSYFSLNKNEYWFQFDIKTI